MLTSNGFWQPYAVVGGSYVHLSVARGFYTLNQPQHFYARLQNLSKQLLGQHAVPLGYQGCINCTASGLPPHAGIA